MARALAKAGPVKPANRMNGSEKAFAKVLDGLIIRGKMKRWWYDAISFRLPGLQNWYKPDFVAVMADDTFQVYDVKGSWSMHGQDRQLIKLKGAGSEFPVFRWFSAMKKRKKDGGGWEIREFTDCDDPPTTPAS